jgi:hypothetical protein
VATPILEDVLRLVQQLSPDDKHRLRTILAAGDDTLRAAQRRRNQAAIDLLDAWAADPQDTDDSWWSGFAQDLDEHRSSDRPLYTEMSHEPDHRP